MRSSAPPRRSSFASTSRRVRQAWPENRDFRILSLDGGGIKGTFAAAFLAELERRAGRTCADVFDLIVGTSTGGILALGLGLGIPATNLEMLYVDRGREIFPPRPWLLSPLLFARNLLFSKHDERALETILREVLGANTTLSDIKRTRLCIPIFDAVHGEILVRKTPHHPDYNLDDSTTLVEVARATSAAPVHYRLFKNRAGYVLGDGGLWANNPIMVGIVEALSAFDVQQRQIKILSLGCGDSYKPIGFFRHRMGGIVPWLKVIFMSLRLQSLSALGQAQLLLGPENILRADVEDNEAASIAMDDWAAATAKLPEMGRQAAIANWTSFADMMLA